MTSNGGEVKQNQSKTQVQKTKNGISRMKCGGSMLHALNTIRKPNRNNHNNMGLKRVRSVDTVGMLFLFHIARILMIFI